MNDKNQKMNDLLKKTFSATNLPHRHEFMILNFTVILYKWFSEGVKTEQIFFLNEKLPFHRWGVGIAKKITMTTL